MKPIVYTVIIGALIYTPISIAEQDPEMFNSVRQVEHQVRSCASEEHAKQQQAKHNEAVLKSALRDRK